MDASDWAELDAAEQYRARVHALAATTRQHIAFSHAAAVVLLGYPWIGPWPDRVDATAIGERGRSTTLMRLHAGPLEDVASMDGLLITSIARTVIDVARHWPLETSVALADAVLAGRLADGSLVAPLDPELLDRELAGVPLRSGAARARVAIKLANGLSGSPGESLSRVTMLRAGIPEPVLQQRFELPGGRIAFSDFYWPEWDVLGEFDGVGKYLRDPQGRSPGEVVVDEKRREDALRSLHHSFARWGWSEARSVPALRATVGATGIPIRPNAVSSTVRWYEPARR